MNLKESDHLKVELQLVYAMCSKFIWNKVFLESGKEAVEDRQI